MGVTEVCGLSDQSIFGGMGVTKVCGLSDPNIHKWGGGGHGLD